MKYTVFVCVLWSLVEVQSQTGYPYVSFMGESLPNHAYVNFSLVGNDHSGSDSVQCHTDLSTCCTSLKVHIVEIGFLPVVKRDCHSPVR